MFKTRPQIDDLFTLNNQQYRVSGINAFNVFGTLCRITGAPSTHDDMVKIPIGHLDQTPNAADISAAERVFTTQLSQMA